MIRFNLFGSWSRRPDGVATDDRREPCCLTAVRQFDAFRSSSRSRRWNQATSGRNLGIRELLPAAAKRTNCSGWDAGSSRSSAEVFARRRLAARPGMVRASQRSPRASDMVVPRVRLWFRGRGFFPGRAKSRRLILKQLRTISSVLDSLADKRAGGRRNLRRCRRPRSDSWGRWAICRIRRECRAYKPADTGPTRGRAARA
jgi:hypothetical protein